MKSKKINETTYLLRLEKGEEIIKTIWDFCETENIKAGYLQGIGAVSEVELALYDLSAKKYHDMTLTEPLEIVNLFATVTSKKLHPHIVVGNKKMQCFGGHLKKGVVSATCEIILHRFKGEDLRYTDKDIGLELLDI